MVQKLLYVQFFWRYYMSNVVKWEKEDNWVEIDTDLCSAADACVDAWPIASDRQEDRLRSLFRRVRFDCREIPFYLSGFLPYGRLFYCCL